ncbi:MAG: hypothetical protein RJQ09_08570 [Cyclobacteriaceae bacterium]
MSDTIKEGLRAEIAMKKALKKAKSNTSKEPIIPKKIVIAQKI